MQMQKGICVELKDNRSVFILPNGRFVKGRPAADIGIGEEGYFYPMAKKKSALKIAWAPVLAAAAIFAIIFALLSPPQEAYAYIQVQINPGVELGIGEDGKIISLRGLNKDGEELADSLKGWKNQPLDYVLDKVISVSLTNSTKEITITTVNGTETDLPLERRLKLCH
ncbi:hypothetical protein [Planomicrobium sp. CPCC 101079]|uniref:anti-sigma-I factor RsgI family protein n=1 Tax=Planomicrobium sp. CPCC 101079 TaxID=2599618 RepID=UPI0011B69D86|nr:hypothetical protein [Planomicrobium sp. CPCC 101079]TWT04810.1 hypothetical protein FQV28_09405 [Planomicrobium sp. CPCC 101079]